MKVLLLFMFIISSCSSPKKDISPDDIAAAIKKDPEKIMLALQEASESLRQKNELNAGRKELERIENEMKNPLTPVLASTRGTLGPDSAPVKIVVYSDFECSFCGRGYQTMESLRKEYGDKVQITVKNLPLSFHPMAMPSAKRFEALLLQDKSKAFAFYHELFQNQRRLAGGEKYLDSVVQKVGGNLARVKKDMDSEAVTKLIADDMAEAQNFGIEGTPGFIVAGVSVRGAYPIETFRQIVDKKLRPL